jgi:hypothetical protein
MRKSIVFFVSVLLFQISASAETPASVTGKYNKEAPPELMHWGKMIGQWRTSEEGLKPDGSGWQPSKGADWNFYWALDGWSIRDEYFSPPLSEAVDAPENRQMGTNIRVYNKDKKQWQMAWVTKQARTVDVYTAVSTERNIVMLSDGKLPSGKHSRITFFEITNDSFEWKLEWSDDGQTNWLEVYRIHGKKIN